MKKNFLSFITGFFVGNLGGLLGLGGAEFRLPILLYVFHFTILSAIVVNLSVSFFTVVFSFIFRGMVLDFSVVFSYILIAVNILVGSLLGSYLGVNFATSINQNLLKKIVAIILILIALLLMFHQSIHHYTIDISEFYKITLGLFLGLIIGIVSSMLGVAGGELIIPTLTLVYGIDIKIAGSLSLLISIPTIMLGLYKYSKKGQSEIIKSEKTFIVFMALGSIIGSFTGSLFLYRFSSETLRIFLGVILIISALKMIFMSKKN
ncbi:MAG: sulfite exporter TauE/SafE family protein [Sulfurihydrogenibium sp.]|uniref:sulfite exporter TauE/SafE family protein n=1 Tax=Sulfurihydrogenibium sp. TaxID=2053621 RepID=UPI003D1041F6